MTPKQLGTQAGYQDVYRHHNLLQRSWRLEIASLVTMKRCAMPALPNDKMHLRWRLEGIEAVRLFVVVNPGTVLSCTVLHRVGGLHAKLGSWQRHLSLCSVLMGRSCCGATAASMQCQVQGHAAMPRCSCAQLMHACMQAA